MSTPVLSPVAVAAADAAQIRNFATAINPSQGTLVIDFVTQGPLANAPRVMLLDKFLDLPVKETVPPMHAKGIAEQQ